MPGPAGERSEGPPEKSARSKPTLRDMQKDFTRKLIIKSALAVFEERGFSRATMDDIAATAGVNRATIYLHFANKAEILEQAVPTGDPLQAGYAALSSARETAEVQRLFGITYDYWANQVGMLFRHISEGAATDARLARLEIENARQQRASLQRILEDWGVPAELAVGRAFAVYAVWVETIRGLGRGTLEVPRDEVVRMLTETFVAGRGHLVPAAPGEPPA